MRGRTAMFSTTQCKPTAAIQYATPIALSSAGSWWAESGCSLAGLSCDPRCAESGFGIVCRFCAVSGLASGRRATQRPIRGRSNFAKSFGLPNCRPKRRIICGRGPLSVASAGFERAQAQVLPSGRYGVQPGGDTTVAKLLGLLNPYITRRIL